MPSNPQPQRSTSSVIVCFAVKEEAAFFRGFASRTPGVQVCVTGMGADNARRGLGQAMSGLQELPGAVITAGFAGGLVPKLKPNDVLVESDSAVLEEVFLSAGAKRGRFHCCARVASTIAEKSALAGQTGADAVEMESGVIRKACLEAGVPCATVRVILDPADQDLPLDFNLLLNAQFELSPVRLASAVIKRPVVIPELLRFQRQTRTAAQSLAAVLQGGCRRFLQQFGVC